MESLFRCKSCGVDWLKELSKTLTMILHTTVRMWNFSVRVKCSGSNTYTWIERLLISLNPSCVIRPMLNPKTMLHIKQFTPFQESPRYPQYYEGVQEIPSVILSFWVKSPYKVRGHSKIFDLQIMISDRLMAFASSATLSANCFLFWASFSRRLKCAVRDACALCFCEHMSTTWRSSSRTLALIAWARPNCCSSFVACNTYRALLS